MKKIKINYYIIAACILLLLQTSCKKNEEAPEIPPKIIDHTSFQDFYVAVIEGTPGYQAALSIEAIPVIFQDTRLATEQVRLDNVGGFIHAYSLVYYIAASTGNEDLKVIPIPDSLFQIKYSAISHDEKIVISFNEYLDLIQNNGLFYTIWERWFSITKDTEAPLPDFTSSGKNGNLKVAICSDTPPFSYMGNDGIYRGFSIDLFLSYAAYIEKRIQYTDVDHKNLLSSIENKNADIAITNLPLSPNPNTKIFYSNPFYDDGQGILVQLIVES